MNGEKVISSDISPTYSGLKAHRLEYLKNKFSEKEIDTKVIILVREPLSRIKSAVRFNLDRGNYSEGIKSNETDFESALIKYYKTEHCLIRTKYQNIISEAESVFASDSIYIGFYENMFEKNEVEHTMLIPMSIFLTITQYPASCGSNFFTTLKSPFTNALILFCLNGSLYTHKRKD